jgi:hypothetical protein
MFSVYEIEESADVVIGDLFLYLLKQSTTTNAAMVVEEAL